MKAVFLDRNTFLSTLDLTAPDGVSDYVVHDSTPQDDDIIVERCMDCDIIIVNKVVIGRAVIEKLPKLKLIQLTATGMNNVDLLACREHGVAVQNVAGYSTDSVPEHSFMLMLTAMRAGRHYHRQATDGTWQADGKFCLLDTPILDLAGRTLGIVGRGAIGQKVGQIATAFGMSVLYADRVGATATPREGYTAFFEVLERADVISLHCPLTEDTHHLINDDTISKMSKKPLIVNVARGAVVDGGAIVRALANDRILGYATDVFEQEPPPADEPLLTLKDHPRVFFTPHNAWGSENAQNRLWAILCERVSGFIKN